jgi:hypothetical protein
VTKSPKRPRDTNQLAKFIIDVGAGDIEDRSKRATVKRASAAGQKGGPARARTLTPEQRSEIAHAAAAARWKKGS